MRELARDKGRIQDIIDYSNNVIELIEGVSCDDLANDKRTYYAVMKNIEIVGEAAYMLTKSFKENHPNTPWKVIEGMRHILVHDYAQVAYQILWGTATESIPDLLQQAHEYMEQTDWEQWEQNNGT